MSNLLKGYRTLLFGLLMVVVPPALNYLVGINWTSYVSPNEAFFISGILTMILRVVTTTPVGTK